MTDWSNYDNTQARNEYTGMSYRRWLEIMEPRAIHYPPLDGVSRLGTDGAGSGGEDEKPAAGDQGETDGLDDGRMAEQAIADALQIKVLGEYEDSRILLFSRYHHKFATIKTADNLKHATLLQIAGPAVKRFVVRPGSLDNKPQGMFEVDEVREAIGLLAGYRQCDDEHLSEMGAWEGLDKAKDSDGSVVLVNDLDGARYCNGRFERLLDPECGGRLLKFSRADRWFVFGQLSGYIAKAADAKWCKATINESIDFFSQWRWRNEESQISATILTGLIVASWVETLWAFRPQVAITGDTNTGKSMLFRCLGMLFGPLAEVSSKSSAAGIRQAVKTTARIPLCDEFEKSQRRSEVLEMIRSSSRGDSITLGTSDQRGRRYIIRHIFWLAAIEVGLKNAADKNRFINMELLPPLVAMAGKLKEPPESEIRDLGQRLLAIAVRHVVAAREMAVRLKSFTRDGIDSRIVESHAVPISILATSCGWEDERARQLLDLALDCVASEDRQSSDQDDLIQAILRAVVRIGPSCEETVASLLQSDSEGHREALERHGVGVCYERRGRPHASWSGAEDEHLFIDHNDVVSKLPSLQRDWSGKTLDKLLKRIDGAVIKKSMLAGRRPSGVWIPMRWIRERFLSGASDEGLF